MADGGAAGTRPPVLDEGALSSEQQAVFASILNGPRGVVEGPLRVWLQSPGLARQAQALGAYCRYGTSLPARLSELAILTVGAHWRSGFEWHVHAPIALAAGISPDAAECIRTGREPALVEPDEQAVYLFSSELLRTRQVGDATYSLALDRLGIRGVVDLVGVLGYYTLISMTINAFHVPVPPGAPEPFDGA